MTFVLNEEQRAFRDVLKPFVDERIAPHAARYDRDQEFPQDSWDACVEMDLPALWVPEQYGGVGADMVTQAVVAEELARGCASTSVTWLISKLGMLPVMNFASEEIKSTYLPRIAAGTHQASYCLSEADAGSDVAAMRCRAERDGDEYVLNGSKYWITNAGVSDTYTVFASTDLNGQESRHHVFPGREGLGSSQFPKHEDKLGLRASPTGEVVFDNVRVPAVPPHWRRGRGVSHRDAHARPFASDHRRTSGRDLPGRY